MPTHKARNYYVARGRHALSDWRRFTSGSGQMAARVIDAFEIHEDRCRRRYSYVIYPHGCHKSWTKTSGQNV